MKLLMVLIVATTGCGTAASDGPIADDASAGDVSAEGDAGLSLLQRQTVAAGALRSEMSDGVAEMLQRYRNTAHAEDVYPAFAAASPAWDAALVMARASSSPDASLPARQEAGWHVTVESMLPAYCAMRAALSGYTPSIVTRLRCDELPITGAWWTRYE